MKKWQVVMLAVLFAGLGTAVFAFGPPFGGKPTLCREPLVFARPLRARTAFPDPQPPVGPGNFGPGFSGGFGPGQYLNLSEDQLNKMGALRDRYLQDTKDLRYALAQQQLEVRRLFTDPKTDEATLLTKQKEMSHPPRATLQQDGADARRDEEDTHAGADPEARSDACRSVWHGVRQDGFWRRGLRHVSYP